MTNIFKVFVAVSSMAPMLYNSLNPSGKLQDGFVYFEDAVLHPVPVGGGLYVPASIAPVNPRSCGTTYQEICCSVLEPYFVGNDISEKDLRKLLESMDFSPGFHKYGENLFGIDLTTPPSEAFKCYGMLPNIGVIDSLSARRGITSTSLTASTGDTLSSAQYHARGKKNLRSGGIFPKGRVSGYQEAQMRRDGDNLFSFCLEGGDFDDCVGLVSKALTDPDLKYLNPVVSNSRSTARLLPQEAYYLAFCKYIAENTNFKKVRLVVPTGNGGNAAAAILAMNAIRAYNRIYGNEGVEIERVVMASNKNDVIPRFYKTGKYTPIANAHSTHSSAMDVSRPSNLLRDLWMYGLYLAPDGRVVDSSGSGWDNLLKDTAAISVSDEITADTMRRWYKEYEIILDPHSAVAASLVDDVLAGADSETACAFVLTAAPKKFHNLVNEILGDNIVKEPVVDWQIQKATTVRNYSEFKAGLQKMV